MYVRTRREGLGQIQSPYIKSSSPFGSYIGDLAQPATLPKQLQDAWNARHNKQEIFDILRQQQVFPLGSAVKTALKSIFTPTSDEFWLSERLADHGPEPLWPLSDIKARVGPAKSLGLGSEPGNYEARLVDPKPGVPLSGSLAKCTDALKPSELPTAFFFPGISERRALIISGVHGDEKRGVQVVESLRTLLETRSKGNKPPFFTTILVPVVILRSGLPCPRQCTLGARKRFVCGLGMVAGKAVCHEVEPNRNFPLPGENLSKAQGRGAANTSAAELHTFIREAGKVTDERPPRGPCTSIRMLPETRILIDLIERFQPECLASIHDHSCQQRCHVCNGRATRCGGEGPGIFVDPRGIDPKTGQITDVALVKEDDELAKRMVEKALKQPRGTPLSAFPPFAGNQVSFPLTVRYFSPQRVEGNSLGDWAPVKAGTRDGIATLTIEVPKYKSAQAVAEKQVIDLHRDLLQEIFLGVR